MQTETLLYIILSGIIALLLALFQYLYKAKASKLNMLFAFLRFLTYFSILLLIINPKFDKTTFYNEKPNLVIATDNSSSVKHLNQDKKAQELINSIRNNIELNNKFNIDFYSFGNDINSFDSINFDESRTNISKVFTNLKQVYQHTVAPTVLITDGNQTYGNDYEFTASKYSQPIYPVILGDTITYSDLKIEQLNVNKYAYLKNKFPVEAIVVYNGKESISTNFVVSVGNSIVFRKPVSLSKTNNSKIINFTLPANSVGVKSYKAQIVPLKTEKNTINNSKEFAVEVINQKTNIALVSNIIHPDLGAIKKSIESNEQRTVSIVKPNEIISIINEFQLVMLYQPNNSFRSIYSELNRLQKNCFTITGIKTDWTFLNSIQNKFSKKVTNAKEEYQAILNTNYSTFIVDDLNFESFPPLESYFDLDDEVFNIKSEIILYKTINGFNTNQPLLATFETGNRREAVLFGEGIWKWRAKSYLNDKSFNQFDDFIGKLVQYLASNQRKNRLNVTSESFYNGNDDIIIFAQYFNKNYEFDDRGNLSVVLKDKISGETRTLPFILKNNNYQVDLSSLPASEYSFTVKVNGEPIRQSGAFKILEYNVEQQFLNANVTKLQQVATNTKGNSYFIDNTDALFANLLNDNRFVTIQKSNKNTVPLIDFKFLLFLIAFSLALEWFLRKYNGLI